MPLPSDSLCAMELSSSGAFFPSSASLEGSDSLCAGSRSRADLLSDVDLDVLPMAGGLAKAMLSRTLTGDFRAGNSCSSSRRLVFGFGESDSDWCSAARRKGFVFDTILLGAFFATGNVLVPSECSAVFALLSIVSLRSTTSVTTLAFFLTGRSCATVFEKDPSSTDGRLSLSSDKSRPRRGVESAVELAVLADCLLETEDGGVTTRAFLEACFLGEAPTTGVAAFPVDVVEWLFLVGYAVGNSKNFTCRLEDLVGRAEDED